MSIKHIRLLIWKEFLQLRRDRLLLPLIFIGPIMQLIMFGYVVGSDVTNIPTAIVDQDMTMTSRALADSFVNTGYFTILERPATESDVQTLMDKNRVQVALLIPPGLEADLARGEQVPVEIIVDGADSKTASVASGYAAQVFADFNQKRIEATGLVPDAPGIDARVRVLFNPTLRSVNAMIPGLVATILLISMGVVMSQAIVRERERGTLEQMFVTPITRGEYLLGKIAPYILLAIIQVSVVMVVGIFWFRVPFHGTLLVIGLGLLLFLFTVIGQSMFISMISRTRQQAQQATMFILIPTMVLSGFIFPLESMPPEIVPVTYFIPLRYALVILRTSFMKGAGLEALWPQFAAMAVFSALILGLALSRFQKRLSD
ncbi:MAG: ABC transporter permease [Coriobacteriia bacterium]|nr:ABC transporter permease [Coriobacteriia bacterium]